MSGFFGNLVFGMGWLAKGTHFLLALGRLERRLQPGLAAAHGDRCLVFSGIWFSGWGGWRKEPISCWHSAAWKGGCSQDWLQHMVTDVWFFREFGFRDGVVGERNPFPVGTRPPGKAAAARIGCSTW